MGLVDYLKETRTELKHVSWATRKQAINFTGLVIGVSLLVALLLGAFDSLFDRGLRAILSNRVGTSEQIVSTSTTPVTSTSTQVVGTSTQPKK
jgi:preprotein translocase SecE subunit